MKRKVRTRKLGIKFKILIPVCVCVLVVCAVSYTHLEKTADMNTAMNTDAAQ